MSSYADCAANPFMDSLSEPVEYLDQILLDNVIAKEFLQGSINVVTYNDYEDCYYQTIDESNHNPIIAISDCEFSDNDRPMEGVCITIEEY